MARFYRRTTHRPGPPAPAERPGAVTAWKTPSNMMKLPARRGALSVFYHHYLTLYRICLRFVTVRGWQGSGSSAPPRHGWRYPPARGRDPAPPRGWRAPVPAKSAGAQTVVPQWFRAPAYFSRTGAAGDDTQLHRVTSPVFSPIVYRKPSLMGSKSRKKDAGSSRVL